MKTALDYTSIFGSNLRAARLRARLKVAEMSERTGISLSSISFIEAGGLAVTIQDIGALAEAVDCPLSTLLEVTDKLPDNGDEPDVELKRQPD